MTIFNFNNVTPTSQVRATTILILPTVGNCKVRRVSPNGIMSITNLIKNPSSSSQVKSTNRQTDGQLYMNSFHVYQNKQHTSEKTGSMSLMFMTFTLTYAVADFWGIPESYATTVKLIIFTVS